MKTFLRFFLFLLLSFIGAEAQTYTIPSDRMTEYSIGGTIGNRTTEPPDGTVWNILNYGGTTNNTTNLGSITTGTKILTFADATGWSVSNGVCINGQAFLITNLSGNTAILNADAAVGGSNLPLYHDNAPVFNNLVGMVANNDVIVIPSGDFPTRTWMATGTRSNIKVRGLPGNKIITLGTGGFSVGPGGLTRGSQKSAYITSVPAKESRVITVASTNFIPQIGELYDISTMNGHDPNKRYISTAGFERIYRHSFLVTNVIGSDVYFTPSLPKEMTNQPFIDLLAFAAVTNIYIEGLNMTTTNSNGEFTSYIYWTDLFAIQNAAYCTVRSNRFLYANNYNLHVDRCVNVTIEGNIMAHALTSGTSHALLLLDSSSGVLIQNNLFDDTDFALQFWGGGMRNAVYGNYFRNCRSTAVSYHSSGSSMDLFSQNVSEEGHWVSDGYYGSNEDFIIYKNVFKGAISLKRFSSGAVVVGNILGTTLFNLKFDRFTAGGQTSHLLYYGEPNIGNRNSTGVSPPMSWNYPQRDFLGNHGGFYDRNRYYTNVYYTFTSNFTGSNIIGNFTNWPYSEWGGYSLVFQDNVNTNHYHLMAESLPPIEQFNGSTRLVTRPHSIPGEPAITTNAYLNRVITVQAGWTMYVASPDSYQQLQDIDYASHLIHANGVYTNYTYGVVLKNGVTETNLVPDLLYTNGYPWFLLGGSRAEKGDPDSTNKLYWEGFYVDTTSPNTNPPVANFSVSRLEGSKPLDVLFTSLTSTTNFVRWYFNTNDLAQTSTSTPTASFTYSNPGVYSVTMMVTNIYGTNYLTRAAYITVTNSTEPPTGTQVELAADTNDIVTGFVFSRDYLQQRFTNTTSGTLTHLSFWCKTYNGAMPTKVALYNESVSSLITAGTVTVTELGRIWCAVTNVPVTAGTVYVISLCPSLTDAEFGYLINQTSDLVIIGNSDVYTQFPEGSLPITGGSHFGGPYTLPKRLAVGMNIDEVGETPPSAPTITAAVPISSSQINVYWTDNSDDEDSFYVYRGTVSGGPYTNFMIRAADETWISDINLPAVTRCYYVLRAKKGALYSSYSAEMYASTEANQTGTNAYLVTNLVLNIVNSNTVNLQWNSATSTPANYVVWYGNSTNLTNLSSVSGTTTNSQLSGVATTNVYFSVVAALGNNTTSPPVEIVASLYYSIKPGYSLVTFPVESATNAIKTYLTNMPVGSALYTHNPANNTYSVNYYTSTFSNWLNPEAVIGIGKSVWFFNPRDTNLAVRVRGKIRQADTNALVQNKVNLVGSPICRDGLLQTSLGYVPGSHASVYLWRDYQWVTNRYTNAAWITQPNIRQGEGFFLHNTTPSVWITP